MQEAGLETIDTYIACRKDTTAQYIVTRPMELFMEAMWRPGS